MAKLGFSINKVDNEHATGVARQRGCIKGTRARVLSRLEPSMQDSMAKLKSFSLFESVVAVSIIAILIAIATLTYGNMLEAEKPLAFYQGKSEIDGMLKNLKKEKIFISQTKDFDTYSITQSVNPYQGNNNLLLVEYEIKAGTKTWWTEKHLVSNDQ